MLAKQIGIVVCRVAAAILLVQAVRAFGFILPAFFQAYGGFGVAEVLTLLASFIPGLVAVFLWIYADRISTVPGEAGEAADESPITQADLIGVGTLVIGLYVALIALFGIVQTELSYFLMSDILDANDSSFREGRQAAQMTAGRITNYVELIIGIALIVGRASIARFLTAARRAGT